MANPMMQGAMPKGPMDAEAGAEQQGEPLKSVTIEQQADGTYLVGTEPSGPDSEGVGEMGTDTAGGMTPAATIDEALDLARQALQDDGMSADASIMKGYNRNKPMPGKPTVGKVFGE